MEHDSDYKNNGLMTKVWGGPSWIFNHSVTFGYPLEPTDNQKANYKNYFTFLGDVLPCRYCRESYQKLISSGDTELTDSVLENRHTLTKWLWKVHNAVNEALEVDYGMSYEDVVAKYESFRAKCDKNVSGVKGCITPLDYKAFSFKKLYEMNAPIVRLNIVRPFIKLAKIRGIDDEYFNYIDQLAIPLNGDFSLLKANESWPARNNFCQCQIKYMRKNAIPSTEPNGMWAGTPTVDELKLMLFLSSNLNRTELEIASKKLSDIIASNN